MSNVYGEIIRILGIYVAWVWVSYFNYLKTWAFHVRPNWKIFFNKIKFAYYIGIKNDEVEANRKVSLNSIKMILLSDNSAMR